MAESRRNQHAQKGNGKADRRQSPRRSSRQRGARKRSRATASGTLCGVGPRGDGVGRPRLRWRPPVERRARAQRSPRGRRTAAWARYAEEVMRHTSEASQALLRAQTFNEMLEVQARLLGDNIQSFLDQSTRIAEAASRMATRPFVAPKEASAEQARR
jgi:hypothetical protein